MTKLPAVEFDSVHLAFGSTSVLHNLSFSVESGEVFALFGPSGCGKSTSLRLVSGLERPQEGRVLVFGRDATSYGYDERRVTTVWQGKALFPHLTVRGNLEFGLKSRRIPRAERRKRILRIAEQLGISALAGRKIEALSGGEQQRVALGRAMVVEPDVLLLDEPFTGLDQVLRWQLFRDLRALLAEGSRTYVLVSHEFESILSLADRVGVMRGGTLVQVDSPENIWQHPTTGFSATLVGWSNVFSAKCIRTNGRFVEVLVGRKRLLGRLGRGIESISPAQRDVSYVLHPDKVVCHGERGCQVEGIYLGKEDRPTDTVAFFELSDIGVLRVRLSEPTLASRLSEGDTIPLSWSPESALVVPSY